MTCRIQVLSDQTINQIAAGEVIENPASVIKELVENAVDAGARHVTIETLGGGFQLIKVSDDGSGMSPEDALLSLQRHATSKLLSADDLFTLSTLGFRGEALASIASISKMCLLTAEEDAPAVGIEVEGGHVVHSAPAARSRGTTIEVRSLFYNVPARKKFQKSPSASSAEITKAVTHLALAHPEVGFELVQQNRTLFALPSSRGDPFLPVLQRRAEALLGAAFFGEGKPLVFGEQNYAGVGFVADPLASRHNRSGQYLFVNRRPVSCPPISYTVRDAFGTRIGSDRHPVYLLHLTLPADRVDVNVHPQKKEVRLREEGIVKAILHAAVNGALSRGASAPAAAVRENPFDGFFTSTAPVDFTAPLLLREERGEILPPALDLSCPVHVVGTHGPYAIVQAESLPPALFPNQGKGVVWVDLPAAESRLEFENLVRYAESIRSSQGLLLPLSVSFSRAEAELLRQNLELVAKMGLEVREGGEAAFIVDAIPPFVKASEVPEILHELIAELERPGSAGDALKLRRLAALVCRRGRFRKSFYTNEEARQIIERLIRAEDPLHCPQGFRTLFHIREEEIERYFSGKTGAPSSP